MNGGKIIHLVVLCLLLTLVVLKFRNVDFWEEGKTESRRKQERKQIKENYKWSWHWDLALDYAAGRFEFSNCFFNLPPLLPICQMIDAIQGTGKRSLRKILAFNKIWTKNLSIF